VVTGVYGVTRERDDHGTAVAVGAEEGDGLVDEVLVDVLYGHGELRHQTDALVLRASFLGVEETVDLFGEQFDEDVVVALTGASRTCACDGKTALITLVDFGTKPPWLYGIRRRWQKERADLDECLI
jgi:hypothetical protein